MDHGFIVVDASVSGDIRFAVAHEHMLPQLSSLRCYKTEELPTFTGALIRFAREMNLPLEAMDGVLAIAGPVSGNAFAVARSRWTISREGLAVMFRTPPPIINDVAARAWAVRAAPTSSVVNVIRGSGQPDFARPGRHILLNVEEGVGCAIIDVDAAGGTRIVESEAGHCAFAATDAMSDGIVAMLRLGTFSAPSWEQAVLLAPDSPALLMAAKVQPNGSIRSVQAAILGRFTVQALLAAAAWNGVIMTGGRAHQLLVGDARGSFDAAFAEARSFGRLVRDTRCWLVRQRDPVTLGAAMMMAEYRRLQGLNKALPAGGGAAMFGSTEESLIRNRGYGGDATAKTAT